MTKVVGLLTAAALLFALGAPSVAAEPRELKWGDAAPPLKVGKWLKGTPIEKFEPGKVYVVEFWATWCGPCKAVMPHLSKLAKKYEGKVTIIGVDVWEEGEDPLPGVQRFVEAQGENMAYNVAADAPPGREGLMATNWLAAARQDGIPATFVVSDEKVVWIGHPDKLARVLPKILDKSYDMKATLTERDEEQKLYSDTNQLIKAINEKIVAKDYAGALKALESDAARALPERQKLWADRTRFTVLLHLDETRAIEYANELHARPVGGNLFRRHVGQIIAETGSAGVALSKETYAFGAATLEKAGELGPGFATGYPFHEYMAICYAGAGDMTRAVAAMRRSIALAADRSAPDPKLIARLEERLKKYKEATGDTSPEAPRVARAKPAKIYNETADGREQIAQALAAAKKNNHRVLIQWGGNWCAWCLRLNELMTTDKAIARAIAANYEIVHIDTGRPEGKNMELAQSYGAELQKHGFPYLTVLDADAKVLANQATSELEAGSINAGHDAAKVLAFLGKNAVSAEESATIARDVTAAADAKPKSKQVLGQPFELRFTDAISGKNIDVQKDLKGKIVVVDFWATWCAPCVAEMPKNKELYAKYRDKGVEFIGVSLDKSEAEGGLKRLKDFIAENHIDWPQYYQGNFVSSEFSQGWGITTIPTVFVIDAEGKLASTQAGGKLEAVIQELIARREGKATAKAQ